MKKENSHGFIQKTREKVSRKVVMPSVIFANLALITPALASESQEQSPIKATGIEQVVSQGEVQTFPDVPPTHPYYEAIQGMAKEGIIGGFSDGTFSPEKNVTRQQFAKMIVNTLGLEVSEANISEFKDVTTSGPDSLYPDNYIAVAAENEITKGKRPGEFAPLDNITRAQVDTMNIRAAQNLRPGLLTKPPVDFVNFLGYKAAPHAEFLNWADYNGLLKDLYLGGEGGFNPDKTATRGEVAQMLWNLKTFEKQEDNPMTINEYSAQDIPDFLKSTLPTGVTTVCEIDAKHPINASHEIDFYLVKSKDGPSVSWESPEVSKDYKNDKLLPRFDVYPASSVSYFSITSVTSSGAPVRYLINFGLWEKQENETSEEYATRAQSLVDKAKSEYSINGEIQIDKIKDFLKKEAKTLYIIDPNSSATRGIIYNRDYGQGSVIDRVIDIL